MANKTLLLVLGLAMIASTASASTYMDAFESFLAAPGPGGLINMIINQLLALIEPIAIGMVVALVSYTYDEITFEMDLGAGAQALPMGTLFAFLGAGNKTQLLDAITQYTHHQLIT